MTHQPSQQTVAHRDCGEALPKIPSPEGSTNPHAERLLCQHTAPLASRWQVRYQKTHSYSAHVCSQKVHQLRCGTNFNSSHMKNAQLQKPGEHQSLKFQNAEPYALLTEWSFIKSQGDNKTWLILVPCTQILKDRRSACTGEQTVCKFVILLKMFRWVGGGRFCISFTSKACVSRAETEVHLRLHFLFYIHSPFLVSLLIIYIACVLCL